jgi:chloride channel 3/4/5
LTGELEYIVPHMIAILVAKWVADSIGREGVYDLAQTVLGHPFLDHEHALQLVQSQPTPLLVESLIPPQQTMDEITVHVPASNVVPRKLLQQKLHQLHRRGLMDAGLVLVQGEKGKEMLQGYIAESELDFGLNEVGRVYGEEAGVRLLGAPPAGHADGEVSPGSDEMAELDLTMFVDRTPAVLCAKAPLEYCVEMFGQLGLRHLCLVEEGTSRLVGVVIKKRLVSFLETLDH